MKFTFIGKSGNFAELLTEIQKSDCEVTVKTLASKSYEQVKAIHLLCSLLAKRLTETQGKRFDLETTKEVVKYRFDYVELASYTECFGEALKMRYQKELLGQKMTMVDFDHLLENLQKTFYVPKSFAHATKEEMINLIESIEEWGVKMNWSEIRLESAEKKALLEYYDNLGKKGE
jgi:hypothetical protein